MTQSSYSATVVSFDPDHLTKSYITIFLCPHHLPTHMHNPPEGAPFLDLIVTSEQKFSGNLSMLSSDALTSDNLERRRHPY